MIDLETWPLCVAVFFVVETMSEGSGSSDLSDEPSTGTPGDSQESSNVLQSSGFKVGIGVGVAVVAAILIAMAVVVVCCAVCQRRNKLKEFPISEPVVYR